MMSKSTKIPNKKNTKKLDLLVTIVAVISPILTLPQVFLIYSTQSAQGVSPLSWAGFVFTSCVWLAYGIAHQQRPIIINSSISGCLSASIAIGAMLFG